MRTALVARSERPVGHLPLIRQHWEVLVQEEEAVAEVQEVQVVQVVQVVQYQ